MPGGDCWQIWTGVPIAHRVLGQPGAGAVIRVLAVDAERLRDELKAVLPEAQFYVTGTTSGERALSASSVFRPDVLVVGRLTSPGLTADQFCAQVRQTPLLARLPVVLHAQSDAEAAAFKSAGGTTHVLRSAGVAALAAAVQRLVTQESLSPQVRVQVLVTVELARGGQTRGKLFANTVALAPGGVLVECSEPLPLKSEVQLGFFLPGCAERISLRASVETAVRGDALQFLLRFQEAGPSRQLLESWLATRLRQGAMESR